MSTRPAVHAGRFYPAQAEALRESLQACWLGRVSSRLPPPKALIVPHAGLRYSGPIAASAYATVAALRGQIQRVVLLGPSHRHALVGCAVPEATVWSTPLGDIPIDSEALRIASGFDFVHVSDTAHAPEHSVEVQLPFLQSVLGNFQLLPVLVGTLRPEDGADLLDALWGGPETLIVVSTDLSHDLDQERAERVDAESIASFERMDPAEALGADACGRQAVAALLAAARRRGMRIQTLDARNSAQTAGTPERVVGYAALLLWPADQAPASSLGPLAVASAPSDTEPTLAPAPQFAVGQRRLLCDLAWAALRSHLSGNAIALPDAAWLRQPSATFVTLDLDGHLRGCIGNLSPHLPLARSVVQHAHAAAFADSRFPKLQSHELKGLTLSISVLSPLQPLNVSSYDHLLLALRPGVDGLCLHTQHHQETFLPSVWEQLPGATDFVAALWRKAGLEPQQWPGDLKLETYSAETWSDAETNETMSV